MKDNRGSAILLVVIILGMTFVIATLMIKQCLSHKQIIDNDINDNKAYYSANTGIVDFIFYISENNFSVKNNTIHNKYDIDNKLFNDINSYYITELVSDVKYKELKHNEINIERAYYFIVNSKGIYRNKKYNITAQVTVFSMYDYTKKIFVFNDSKGYIINKIGSID